MNIPVFDLTKQNRSIEKEIDSAIKRRLSRIATGYPGRYWHFLCIPNSQSMKSQLFAVI